MTSENISRGEPEEVIPLGFFQDAVNPTDEEITRWAYISGAHYPPEISQDWDLVITEPNRADMFLRFVSDPFCPNRDFFLSCLYLLIGDAVRSKGRRWSLDEVVRWLERQSPNALPELKMFFLRAKDLLRRPETFSYEKWCGGGYAYGAPEEPAAPGE